MDNGRPRTLIFPFRHDVLSPHTAKVSDFENYPSAPEWLDDLAQLLLCLDLSSLWSENNYISHASRARALAQSIEHNLRLEPSLCLSTGKKFVKVSLLQFRTKGLNTLLQSVGTLSRDSILESYSWGFGNTIFPLAWKVHPIPYC